MGKQSGQTPSDADPGEQRKPQESDRHEDEQQQPVVRPAQERSANASPVPGKDERRNRAV